MEEKGEEDDRWTNFVDESSKKKGKADETLKPEITLNDTMLRVMSQKGQAFRESQEIKLKTATEIIQMVTKKAFEISVPWRLYVQRNGKDWAKCLCIRSVSRDQVECIVPLIRPVRPDAFQLQQLPISDLPQHRCLVRTDPSLSRSDLALVEQQWNVSPELDENCIDKNGFFRPDRVLAWFNRGLREACQCIPIKRLNIEKLEGKNAKDGTTVISTALRTTPKVDRDDNIVTLSINVIPCIVVTKLPTTFKIRAPLPCFSPYLEHQKELRSTILDDLEIGKEIVFLDPRMELDGSDTKICRACPISWQINMTLLQERIFNIVVSMNKSMNFNNILSLISIIRNERVLDFGAITEDVVIHTACVAFRKNVGKLNSRSEWFLQILKCISEGFKRGFISNYFCPRQNLLVAIDKASISKTYKKLKTLLEGIESDPEKLYEYTNYEAAKEDKDEDSDDNSDDAGKVEKTDKEKPSVSIRPESTVQTNCCHTYDGTTTLISNKDDSTVGSTNLDDEPEGKEEEKDENVERHLQNDDEANEQEGKSREELIKPEAEGVQNETTEMSATANEIRVTSEEQENDNRKF